MSYDQVEHKHITIHECDTVDDIPGISTADDEIGTVVTRSELVHSHEHGDLPHDHHVNSEETEKGKPDSKPTPKKDKLDPDKTYTIWHGPKS